MSPANLFEHLQLPGWVCSCFDPTGIQTDFGGEISSPDTCFPLASVTKTFTAHLCLQPPFREFLDTPFIEVMPYFRLADAEATKQMTPRDALCHYSGLAPHTGDWVRCDLSRKAYIENRLPLLPSAGPFREKHRYSNLMYAVLGQWIEEISGTSWEDLLTCSVLKKLKLNRTGHLDESWTRGAPTPYALNAQGDLQQIPPFYARKHHLIAPASELIGSMPDLARWGQNLLSLDPQDERWQPYNRIRNSPPLDYGLGWRLDSVNGEPRVWHSGQCSGYTTLILLYPRKKTGSAVASNRSDGVEALQEVASHLCRIKF